MRCEEPMKIIEILRLTEQGFNQRDIAKSAGCSKTTVGEVQRRCREAKISYEKASTLPYEELNKLIYPAATSQNVKKEPDFGTVYDELQRHPKLNLRFLWN